MTSASQGQVTGHPLSRAPGLLLVTDTPKGRGVFASQRIYKGTVVEVSPVLKFSCEEVEFHTSRTVLQHYTYYWPSQDGDVNGKQTQTQALALGLGSMFNHSSSGIGQNIVWTRDLSAECIVYTAHRDIEVGEELCISYGNGRLWFEDAESLDDPDDVWTRIKKAEGDAALEMEVSGLGSIAVDEDEKDELKTD